MTIQPSAWRWRVALTDPALADLRDINAWTRQQFGTAQERRYRRQLRDAIGTLRDGPDQLHSRGLPQRPGLRCLLVPGLRHQLFYRVQDDRILILRLLHTGQDTPRHLPD